MKDRKIRRNFSRAKQQTILFFSFVSLLKTETSTAIFDDQYPARFAALTVADDKIQTGNNKINLEDLNASLIKKPLL